VHTVVFRFTTSPTPSVAAEIYCVKILSAAHIHSTRKNFIQFFYMCKCSKYC